MESLYVTGMQIRTNVFNVCLCGKKHDNICKGSALLIMLLRQKTAQHYKEFA